MRVCLIYDCLFPHTVGGAERWYRNLAERLSADGHDVTYLTLRQWPRGADPGVSGVRVVAAGPRLGLYTRAGRRRIGPPLVFGLGVLAHLARRGRRYDVVHTASFPYFSLLAAGLVRRRWGFRLVVDWHELWTQEYWRDYLGRAGGWAGWRVQRACARLPQRAFCFSRLHADRLRREGVRGEVTVLEGEYAGTEAEGRVEPYVDSELVVFAGRHIPEKRVPALVPALAAARASAPGLRAEIYGDGPERERVLALVREHGLADAVAVPGFVDHTRIDAALRGALCMVLPSRREGYGLVVVEACAAGTPSVVVADPDNAATELIEDGVNGFVAPSASPQDLAAAILRVRAAGPELRASTAAWYAANARRLSLAESLERVAAAYRP
ncbi:MAG TPA: glycosyltransferase family 4 protein [Solirubrobacteraceae bacterium]|nr:glycosyltransferase family 4 protein [Solirubrobacteraceae bacterium]